MEKRYPTLPVPIGNAKETGEMKFQPLAPKLEYKQKASNSYCFSSLASSLTASGVVVAARNIELRIKGSLKCQSKGY